MSNEESANRLRVNTSADEFMAMAKEQAGLSDFGDEFFVAGLKKLLECVDNDVDFHAQGIEIFKSEIVRCLTNRLRMEDDIKRHPEIVDEDVSDPIIVIGLGRSGTTKLQKMLSASDEVQKAIFWRMWNPAPFGPLPEGEKDPRIAAANFSALMSGDNPEIDAAHHIAHYEVEEEWMLYYFSFSDWVWSVSTPSPSYFDWVMQQSSVKAYQDAKRILQYLQWQDGGKRNRPWILKAVGHTANLEALMACYPKATLVHAHRDPLQTIPSWAKFQADIWAIQSKPIDLHAVGENVLKYYKLAMARYLESRERLHLDARIVDVNYEQIRSDPMAAMRAIYACAGLSISADAEQKMIAWNASNEQGKFGRHVYNMTDFGLTPEKINSTFTEYIERFIAR